VEDPGQKLGLELVLVGGVGHVMVAVGLQDDLFGVSGSGMDMDCVACGDEFVLFAVNDEYVGNQGELGREVELKGFSETGVYGSLGVGVLQSFTDDGFVGIGGGEGDQLWDIVLGTVGQDHSAAEAASEQA
jgi:hypothetical protein